MQTKEQNAAHLVFCMGEYSLLVANVSLFHRNVCSELHWTKFTCCMNWSTCSFLFGVQAGCSSLPSLFLGTRIVISFLSGTYHCNILETNGLTAYFVSFYVVHLVLMPFLQYLHETRRYLHIFSDVTARMFQSANVQHRVESLSTLTLLCSVLVTAHITDGQAAAITY